MEFIIHNERIIIIVIYRNKDSCTQNVMRVLHVTDYFFVEKFNQFSSN